MKSYTTRDVAKLLGLSEAQVRSQARGYLAPDRGPRNTYRFSFQDLVLLRTAKTLGDARISAAADPRRAPEPDAPAPAGPLAQRRPHHVRRRPGRRPRRGRGLEPRVGAAPARLRRGRAGGAGGAGGAAAGPRGAPLGRAAHLGAMVRSRRGPRDRVAGRRVRRLRAGDRARLRGTSPRGSISGGCSRRAGARRTRRSSIAPRSRPSRRTRPPPSTWAPRSRTSAGAPTRSRRTGGRSSRTRSSPTRTSIWRGCTRRPASARRRCGI